MQQRGFGRGNVKREEKDREENEENGYGRGNIGGAKVAEGAQGETAREKRRE